MRSGSLFYPYVSSELLLVPHSDELLVPFFTHLSQVTIQYSERDTSASAEEGATTDQSFSVPNHPRPLNEFELKDLVRDFNLSKECAEVLTSRLKENYLVNDDMRVTYYRKRHDEFV